jgi:hypothetical protein
MAIRHRTVSIEAAPPVVNVINLREHDARGTFDPKRDAITGSYIEHICGEDATAGEIRATIGAISHDVSQRGQQLAPNDLHVQNLLANVRVMDNPGENVERTYRNRIRSPLTGIRAFCVHDCKAGSPKAVSSCAKLQCPLWPFRMGKHGLR